MKRIRNFIGKQYDFLNAFILKGKYLIKIIFQLLDKSSFYYEFKEVTKEKDLTFFVSHNLGGGTELYVNNYLKTHTNVVLISNIMKKIDIAYKVYDVNSGKSFYLFNLKKVLCLQCKILILNSLVSYHNIPKILGTIIKYKKKNNFELIYNIHDFHCICPRHNLVNKDFFCYLNCKENKCKFSNDYECTSISITRWRGCWQEFLFVCDKVICFCKSAKKYLLDIYKLDEDKIFINPHDISYIKYTKIENIEEKKLHLGIIGACNSIPKGKKEVETLLRMLPVSIPVTFVGTEKREYNIQRENILFTGKYENGRLQDYIEKNNISIVFFPSIWPETFSYLLSELIKMEIPIIGYNFGAQAEKLSIYNKGFLCNNLDEVYKIIISLYK